MSTVRLLALVAGAALLAGCSAEDTSPGSVEQLVTGSVPEGSVRLADAYDEGVSRVVVVCAFDRATDVKDEIGSDWSGADSLEVEENEQAVVAVRGDQVVEHEVMSRRVLDLCADPDVSYPASADPAAALAVTSEKWSDGADYPVVDLG